MARPKAWPHYFPSCGQKASSKNARLALSNSRWLLTFRTTIRQTSIDLSASWRASMEEIIKSAIVIHPAFCCEMTFVTDKKGWVLIVPLKFH